MLELPSFMVTPQAVEQIERVGGSVRVDVVDAGCCGLAYAYAADAPVPGDRRYGCPGAWLVVSTAAERVLAGARLDYGAGLKPPRFRVTGNPNTSERCPCNRSFGSPWPGRGQPQCQARTPMPWDREE
ncbi:MAG: hypothetical protein M3513_17665 [Actinomycetota bacterium]|nr:hypothetical protein [Actinomycetota bacterium]